MNIERLNIYDSQNRFLGYSLPRQEVHEKGLWHRTLHCWVIYRENNEDYILLQQRSASKSQHPNKLDITAAGHYSAEDLASDKFREIEEEIGLQVKETDLIYANVRICVEDFEANIHNREFQDVYFLIRNQPIEDYRIQFSEVQALIPLPIDKGLLLLSGQIAEIQAISYKVVGYENNYSYQKEAIAINKMDFVRSLDNYPYKAMILAKRILNGEKHIAI